MKCFKRSARLPISLANAALKQNAECYETNVGNTLGNATEIAPRQYEVMYKENCWGTTRKKPGKAKRKYRETGAL